MIAQPALRPATPAAAPARDAAPLRQPAQEADILLGALVYNWSLQRIALTLTLPAAQLPTTERLVARLRKAHELALQPLSLTTLLSEEAGTPGLTARIRFDYAMTPARVAAHLAKSFPALQVVVKADTADRSGRTVLITLQD